MIHVNNNGGENYAVPYGLRRKLMLICQKSREHLIEANLHLERLSVKWRTKLLVGLTKLLGAANVVDIQEINVLLVDGVYKAECPRCEWKISIQEKSRNVFNAASFYRHVETHFDNFDSDSGSDLDDAMEISADETGRTGHSRPSPLRQPPRKRPRLDPSDVRSVSSKYFYLNFNLKKNLTEETNTCMHTEQSIK